VEGLVEHCFCCRRCGQERSIWSLGEVVGVPNCPCGGVMRTVVWEQTTLKLKYGGVSREVRSAPASPAAGMVQAAAGARLRDQ
jgi:hypothetical protein